MCFLQKYEIEKRLEDIIVAPPIIGKDLLGPASIDLRLGNEVYVTSSGLPQRLDSENEWVSIAPGEFALLMTHEEFEIPEDLIAFISIKFNYTVLGLINVSGFHVDPGYKGKISFSVYNAGPNEIVLKYKEPIFIMFFSKLISKTDKPYDGKHKEMKGLSFDHVTKLKGPGEPFSFSKIIERTNKLEHTTKTDRGIVYTLLVILFSLIVVLFTK